MKLFNKSIDDKLFKQYPLGSDLSKQEVVAKIFNPYGRGSWFIINSDPNDPDYLWAIVDLGHGVEVGSVSRSELETYKNRYGLGFELDSGFEPINAEKLYEGLLNDEYFMQGGETFSGGGGVGSKLYNRPVIVEKKDVSRFENMLNKINVTSPYSEDVSDKQFNTEQVEFYFKNEEDREKAFNNYHEIFNGDNMDYLEQQIQQKEKLLSILDTQDDKNTDLKTRLNHEILDLRRKLRENQKGEMFAGGGGVGNEIKIKKRNFDVIILPKKLEIEVQITRADTVDTYGLNDAEVEWHQERWGYVIKADDNKKLNKALRVLGITKKYAEKGVYVETLDEEIDLSDDGKPRVKRTQEGKKMSEAEWMAKHNDSMETRAYAKGGSLGNHGLKQGDQIIKTLSGGIQKVKTKSGDVVYVDLASGYRGAEPPLPFDKGGRTRERKYVNHSEDYEVRYSKDKPHRRGYGYENGGNINSELENFDINNLDYFETMQYNQFLPSLGKVGALKVLINNVEGDYSQLSEELAELAEKQMSTEEWNEATREIMFERDGYAKGGGVPMNYDGYVPTYQIKKIHTKDGKVFENVYSDSEVLSGIYYSDKPLRSKEPKNKNQMELFKKGGLPKTSLYIPRYNVDFIETDYDGKIQGNHIYGGVWIDMKKQFRLVEEAKKQGRFANKPKFEVDEVVYNKRTKSVGIVRIAEERGEVKTDADGNVSVTELEVYNPLKFKHQSKAKVAPSTQKEIDERGLYKPFSYSVGGGVQNYRTLSFKTKSTAEKNQKEITNYFGNRVLNSNIKKGIDERGDNGYYVEYNLKKEDVSYSGGGKTTFKEKATAIAKNFEGKKVEPKYQKEYGKVYDKAEAKEVGNKIAGSQKAKYDSKMSGGGSTKTKTKTASNNTMVLAKQIRKDGESWQSAMKRAKEQLAKK